MIYLYPGSLHLREEVDILQHLCQVVVAEGGPHPNVLTYIDSWEEDKTPFIQAELCELGNFARFLWEHGKAFVGLPSCITTTMLQWILVHDTGVVFSPYRFVVPVIASGLSILLLFTFLKAVCSATSCGSCPLLWRQLEKVVFYFVSRWAHCIILMLCQY